MGYIYFDESIRERGGFIIGAFVYADHDLSLAIDDAIMSVGLKRGADEFKSSIRMSEAPVYRELREAIWRIMDKSKIGILVLPSSNRANLGDEALKALELIASANNLTGRNQQVYFDEGIKVSEAAKNIFAIETHNDFILNLNQNSKTITGIQAADLAAHSLGIMLLENLGLISKEVRAGDNSGYPPETMMKIGFEMWARLRRLLFMSRNSKEPMLYDKPIENYIDARTHIILDIGLYVSEMCNDELRKAAIDRFGESYQGCIH